MKKNQINERIKIIKYLNRYYKFTLCELSGAFYYQRRDGKTKRKVFETRYFYELLSGPKFRYDSGIIREALRAIHYSHFNAVEAYFCSLPYLNATCSPFDQLDGYFELADTPSMPFGKALEMHMVRAIRCALQGKPNRFVFALVSKQEYLGKTKFIESLMPKKLRDYCMSTLSGKSEKRDVILASKFLVNIDEFANIAKSSSSKVKAMISQQSAALWVSFKNCIEQKQRITSFFATANINKNKPLLSDESSNSRYVIYNVKAIDWSYSDNINVDELWSHALNKARDASYRAELNIEEVREVERYNKRFSTRPIKTLKKGKRASKKSIAAIVAASASAGVAFALSTYGRTILLGLLKSLGRLG